MPRRDAGAKDVHRHEQIVNGQGYAVQCAGCKQRGPAFFPLLPPATPDGIEQRELFDTAPEPVKQDPAGHVGAMAAAERAGWTCWSGKVLCPRCRAAVNGRKLVVDVWLGAVSDE